MYSCSVQCATFHSDGPFEMLKAASTVPVAVEGGGAQYIAHRLRFASDHIHDHIVSHL